MDDIDFVNKQIHINKTCYCVNGKDIITTSKTEQLARTIDIPDLLNKEIMEYVLTDI